MAPVGLHAAWTMERKAEVVEKLLELKAKSGHTFDELAGKCGLTNAYTVQLFLRQAQLKPATAEKLKQALPGLDEDLVSAMMQPPMRSYDPAIKQDPTVYRIHEATDHYAEGFKLLINEKFGDGIMSAINFYCNVDKVKGKEGEDRVVITFNGKFLPYNEQVAEDNTAVLRSATE